MENKKSVGSILSQYFIIVIFVALMIVLTILKPSFLSWGNIVNILKQTSIIGILSFGMMFVIISGGFDMSAGSNIAFTGVIAALLGNGDYNLVLVLLISCLAGLGVGILNGIGVTKGSIPPFIMTLGTMTGFRGAALLLSNGKPVTGTCEAYRYVAAGDFFGVPLLAIYFIIVIVVCSFVLSKTVFGRRVYAVGGNTQAARVAGINTTFIKSAVFAISGLLAGLCGFLMTSRVTIGQPTAAEGYEMDAITACVIGGVSMSGGVGKPWGVVIGALLITVISNGLDIMGVNTNWQKVVKGLIIVIAVLIDVKSKERKS